MSKWFETACAQRACLLALLISCLLAGSTGHAADGDAADLTRQLRQRQKQLALKPLPPLPAPDSQQVALGRWLFFDPILSGNKDTACATCHHPRFVSADGRRLSIGTGGTGLGPYRRLGPDRRFSARHSTDLFERARPQWRVFFWDGRLQKNTEGLWQALTVSGQSVSLPAGLNHLPGLAVQAMLPPLARVEMRGRVRHTPAGLRNDIAIDGTVNELAAMADLDLDGLWQGLQQRIMRLPDYKTAFAQAFPPPATAALAADKATGFAAKVAENTADKATAARFMQQVGLALQAFMQAAFRADNTPWDRFLAGDDAALTPAQKRGALLFYGKAQCARCHRGALFTDQRFHNIAVMPYAASLLPGSQQDLGRFMLTRDPADRYAFRTPPLRNVALTAPYFHNGSAENLTAAIRQHVQPQHRLQQFDWHGLPWELRQISRPQEVNLQQLLATRDSILQEEINLDAGDIKDLVAFLQALTDPRAETLQQWQPETVPSGLKLPADMPSPEGHKGVH